MCFYRSLIGVGINRERTGVVSIFNGKGIDELDDDD